MKKCKCFRCLDYSTCNVSNMTKGEVKALPCITKLLGLGYSFEQIVEMQFEEVSDE